ncbi:MAG: hypothetical protein LJF30_09515 [Acidobacteria bacterium]|jgi:hypothetical protein|nr:hypothetical protein [Acidobacteriota bacterium]
MNADRRVALSNFYREEFLRHIEYLQASGILDDGDSEAVSRARRALTRLDDACSQASFPALAESLLQGFDTLTRLSRLDPNSRQRH